MKKWLLSIGILLIVLLGCVYLIIPASLSIVQVTPVHCSPNGAHRLLADAAKWRNWANSSFKDYKFTFQQSLPHGVDILVQQKGTDIPSRIVVMPVERDSISMVWQCTYPTSNNPFKRIAGYQQATDLKDNFNEILQKFKAYAENTANIYGYNIQQTSTTDTLLMAVRGTAATYPSIQEVYKLVNHLKDYIITNGAQQTGYPMLNVTPVANNQFQFQVAVPVNKMLPDKGNIFSRRMVPGNFMMLEAKGGPKTVDHAMKQLQQYAVDYQRTSMAIPFQVMITDRLQEQDTTKWITRIYYPVM